MIEQPLGHIVKYSAFTEGLLLELLNPLAFSFFVSILLVMINPSEPWNIKMLYWLEIIIIGSAWFCGIAFFASFKDFSKFSGSIAKPVEIITGIIFIYFGIKLLYNLSYLNQ